MKKLTYILTAMAMFIFATSCKDEFLELKSPDQINTSTFWRNIQDAESGLASAYSQMECRTSYWGFAEYKFTIDNFRSDYIQLGADGSQYPEFQELANFNPNGTNYLIVDFWKINYRGLNYANQVIEKVGAMNESNISVDDKIKIIAEARFLRAYYHFRILMNWEKIIIQDKAPAGEDDLVKPLSTRAEAWDFIIADLEAAAADLPWKQPDPNTGRATKGSALGYLGKSYLYRASEEKSQELYQKAANVFAELTSPTARQYYELLPSFISSFDGSKPNSKESLLELQFTTSEANGAWFMTPYLDFLLLSEMGGWDEYKGTQELIIEMKKEGTIASTGRYDTRLYETVFFDDPYFNDPLNPRIYGELYNDKFPDEKKIQFRKYLPPTPELLNNWDDAGNIVILRYSDVLLMYAETLNELGRTSEALPFINEVRNRADMPDFTSNDKTVVFNQIVHERTMELTVEGWRFYDLRRWGLIESAMTAAGRNYSGNAFFPIPDSELSGNDAISK